MRSTPPSRGHGQGAIHGRFQVFHNGHLEYLEAALARCDRLTIGLTAADLAQVTPHEAAAHRSDPAHNPLTLGERTQMMEAVLAELRVDPDRVRVTAFPLERPERLATAVPLDVVMLTTIYDDWNRAKIRTLSDLGYTVEVLWERSGKPISGHRVRQLVRDGDDRWQTLVPASVARFLRERALLARVAGTAG